ncbi:SOS response-associated peptidase [Prochlorococcus sp. MIT 1223]|uniref:SOS response-associated peptidase n=1 Tax=Prochlorococcus sp. MIT 1223 TaxID=3096217 RepID=UPI002A7621A8|nr:SOS response-associated peptidase [Prochlorococcus sp. MIT 1223]
MCSRYQLTSDFKDLPDLLKRSLPKNLEANYSKQNLIKPDAPVLVLKNEGKAMTSIMLWGFISEWANDPFSTSRPRPRPFNARAETVKEKKLFRNSWRHKRCLLPANGFFEKKHLIRRKDSRDFWLGGIWSKWMSQEGSELESCCVLTTTPNKLIRPLHNRMPVIIPYGLEEEWIEPVKSTTELQSLDSLLMEWDPDDWISEPINQKFSTQLTFFE